MSDAILADVVTTLRVNGVSNRPQRIWGFESTPFEAEFRAGTGGPLLDVEEVTFAFETPGGVPIRPVPQGFVHRVSTGLYRCHLAPAAPGRWEAVVRCRRPTSSVAVRPFWVEALPASIPEPLPAIVTDDTGQYALLTRDGLLLRTKA